MGSVRKERFSVRCRNSKCRHRRMTTTHPDSFAAKKTVCKACGSTKGWRIELRLYVKNQVVCHCNGYWFPHRYNSPMCFDRRFKELQARQFVPQGVVCAARSDMQGQQLFRVGDFGCCSAQDDQQAKRLLCAYVDMVGALVDKSELMAADATVVQDARGLLLFKFGEHDCSDDAKTTLYDAHSDSCQSFMCDAVLSVGQSMYSQDYDALDAASLTVRQ